MQGAAAVCALGIFAGFKEFCATQLENDALVEILSDWNEDFPGHNSIMIVDD